MVCWLCGCVLKAFENLEKKKGIIFVILFIVFLSWVGIISLQAVVRFVSNVGHSASGKVEEVVKESKNLSQVVAEKPIKNEDKASNHPDPQPTKSILVSRGVEFETPVRSFSRQAQWVESTKMFRDERGFFITPPNLLMWDGDRGNMEWIAPFEEFARFHPQQAERIAQRYANSRLNYEYFNVEGIVRKYGPRARPR
jgi:hypothetical protein